METDAIPSLLEYALLNGIQKKLGGDKFSVTHDSNGLSLSVTSLKQPALHLKGLKVDEQGITGHLSLDTKGGAKTQYFSGFEITLSSFDIALQNGAFSNTNIIGQLNLPYFNATLNVEIGVRSGELFLALAAQQDPKQMTPDGRVRLNIGVSSSTEDSSEVELIVDTLEIRKVEQVYKLKIGGALTVQIAGLSTPTVAFQGLWIDSQGNVELEGGWLNLPNQAAIDLYGFKLELKRLGLGRNESGGRFIGFNGEVQLVEGLPLGGSVRGLVINLDTGAITFDGVAVQFQVPGVLNFVGDVNFVDSREKARRFGIPDRILNQLKGNIKVFLGAVRVDILAMPGLSLDAKLVIGKFGETTVFFLAFEANLPPPGIAVFPGISLYGIEGLFATGLRPDPQRDGATFWEWYKYGPGLDRTKDSYTASDPQKWLPYVSSGALALGAGGTIGTSDNGFSASASVALVLMFPGPVISLIGKAQILSTRSNNPKTTDALNMNAMAVYDATAETFDLNIDVRYDLAKIIDLSGSAAVHASKNEWYFALGLPPRDKRIRARILEIFESNAYFVVSNKGIVFGSYIGYDKALRFGPFFVSFNVFLAVIGAVQWEPFQYGGGIQMHGEVRLRAFGVGLGLMVDTLLEATAPDPFWIHGSLEVTLELPWPLPDLHTSIDLEWGPEGSPPKLPYQPTQIAATLRQHYDTRDSYTLAPEMDSSEPHQPTQPLTLIPQDAHFTLRFPPASVVTVELPSIPPDDLSKLGSKSLKTQWVFERKLLEVSLLQHIDGSWKAIAAQPAKAGIPALLGLQISATGTVVGNDELSVIYPGDVIEDGVSLKTGILPSAPGVYALKIVTQVSARRVDSDTFQPGQLTTEICYFQTAGGPGLIGPGTNTNQLAIRDKRVSPRFMLAGVPESVFPYGGALLDLSTYYQASYPEQGAAASYFGYDVSVEFNETYVNQLYRVLGQGDVGESLHFRCMDRNRRHVILDTIALRLPSLRSMSILVTEVLKVPNRKDLQRSKELSEIYPRTLQPQTRYSLDVVPGPSNFDGYCLLQSSASEAIQDLREYYNDEKSLPTLIHLEFSTSRYATFQHQFAAVIRQPSIRKYLVANNPFLAMEKQLAQHQSLLNTYTKKQQELMVIAQDFTNKAAANPALIDPAHKARKPPKLLKQTLKEKRDETEKTWQQFSSYVSQLFDQTVAALGRSDLASTQHAPLPPVTELSALILKDGTIPVLLLESPEPMPWRRITAAMRSTPTSPITVLWNVDRTRSLLLLKNRMFQPSDQIELTFRGNLGAETPCISRCGEPVIEIVTLMLDRLNA